MNCIFCQIAEGVSPSHIIWEDEKHLSFLSIYPNTPGFTVVIPKSHHSSYAFEQTDLIISELVLAAKNTALLIDRALPNVARTGMILEGYGVDHLHAKLFPMHGTGEDSKFRKISSCVDTYFDQYEGYISSHDSARADDSALSELAAHIKSFS
ncbi:HIT family protein [Pseudomonas urmiensis]|uniref:HIT family protein n=1 Tax=Pseudomonas urmiensis TaxID=2745493 RepID=UPI003D09FA54